MRKIKEKDDLLEQATANINLLKSNFQNLFYKEEDTTMIVKSSNKKETKPTCVSSVPIENDEGYFNTYAHYSIHLDMLAVGLILN